MNCCASISVFHLFGATLHTREASAVLMQAIEENPCDEVELDFSSVTYISRSFADQFHIDKLTTAERHQKTIIVANAETSVLHMLQAVAKTQNRKLGDIPKIPIYKFTTHTQLENFLLGF